MAISETFDLGAYMSNSIRTIMAKAYKSVLSNPREAKFAYRMQTLFQKSEKRRRKMQEQEGLEVPPFLISSISTTCNLHCKGCYARSNGIAEDEKANQKPTLTPEQWQRWKDCWKNVVTHTPTLSSCRSQATRKPSVDVLPQVVDSSTLVPTVRQSPVRSRPSATAT